jgi:2-dehydro-3-deoxyphosphogluconate aldolase / (4S)-4-hydroxy-2-oxoglutarate aldolase
MQNSMDPAVVSTRQSLVRRVTDTAAVAVIRMSDSKKLIRVAQALHAGGVTAIEVTMTVPDALSVIAAVAREMGDDILLGVGSVLDADTARRAIEAGARYVVSPVFKREIVDAAHEMDCPAMPGAFTPTEALVAQEYGADIVKIFPADVVGMAFFKGVLAPMPHLRLMPTGGVTLTNAGEWMRAGAVAVGVGGALLDKKAIAEENYDQLTENARILRASVEAGRR